MRDYKANVIFLVPSNGTKPLIVLNNLFRNTNYIENYFTKCIVDVNSGKLIELLELNEIPYRYVKKKADLEGILNNLKDKNRKNILVSCGWGKIIPANIIEMNDIIALNCHSSYLPDYKGGSVYLHQWANLEKYGGATVHYLSKQFDSGNILCRDIFSINLKDTPHDILIKASNLTSKLIFDALELIENDEQGFENIGGRYFKKTNKYNLSIHRYVNLFLSFFSNRRWLTRWK